MNRQIGVADSKYVVLDDPLPPGHVTRALQILPLKWPISSTTQQWIKLEAKKCGSKYASMDFYTNSTFQVQKGRGLGSRDPNSKFWDPFISFEQISAICFKFGTYIED